MIVQGVRAITLHYVNGEEELYLGPQVELVSTYIPEEGKTVNQCEKVKYLTISVPLKTRETVQEERL